MDFTTEQVTLWVAIFGAFASSVSVYLSNRKKNRRNDFEALVEANTKFREEIRDDLKQAKEELEEAYRKIQSLELTLDKKDEEIAALKSKIESLIATIENLENTLRIYEEASTKGRSGGQSKAK
jgi:peptidoglycan hydrolase CwlO-like protein